MSVKTSWMGLLCGLALTVPLAAQETPPTQPPPEPKPATAEPKPATAEPKPKEKASLEDPPLHRWGGWTLSVAGWQPSPQSLDEETALVTTAGITQQVVNEAEASWEETFKAAYHLPKEIGSIAGLYDGYSEHTDHQALAPGQFVFDESRAFPEFTGVFNDNLSDGVVSSALMRTKEFRLEFQRKAFDTKWARATWGAGYHGVSHQRSLAIDYHALAAPLPPLILPVITGLALEQVEALLPFPDTVSQTSDYTGHGLGASFDVEFPLHRRVSIVSGVSVGLIRGEAQSNYRSTSSFYALNASPNVPLTTDQLIEIMANPLPEGTVIPPDQPPPPQPYKLSDLVQVPVVEDLRTVSQSETAQSFDVYVGVQALVYRGLRVFLTARQTSFRHVGAYIVPRVDGSTEQTTLNAGYDGYQLGLSYRF